MGLSLDKLPRSENLTPPAAPIPLPQPKPTPADAAQTGIDNSAIAATTSQGSSSPPANTPDLQSAFGNAAISQTLAQPRPTSEGQPGREASAGSRSNAALQAGLGNGAVARAAEAGGIGRLPTTPAPHNSSSSMVGMPNAVGPSVRETPAASLGTAGVSAPRALPQTPQSGAGGNTLGPGRIEPAAATRPGIGTAAAGPGAEVASGAAPPVSATQAGAPAATERAPEASTGAAPGQAQSAAASAEAQPAATVGGPSGQPGPERSSETAGRDEGVSPEAEAATAPTSAPADEGGADTALIRNEPPAIETTAAPQPDATAGPPALQALLAQLQATIAQKKAEILAASSAAKDAIHTQAETKRQEVVQGADQLVQRTSNAVTQSRAQISSAIAEQQAALARSLVAKKEAARRAITGQSQRLGTEAANLSLSVLNSARDKTRAAAALGPAQSTRAQTEVARQTAEARRRGARKAASIHDQDPERAQSQQYAVLQVAAEQAEQIAGTAASISQFAIEHASGIATTFTDKANQVATQINSGVPQVQVSVLSLSSTADAQMDGLAQTARASLAQLEQRLLNQLDGLQSSTLTQTRGISREIVRQINAAERAGLDQVDSITQQATASLDASAGPTMEEAQAGPDGEPDESRVGALQGEITQAALTNLQTVGQFIDAQMQEIVSHATAGYTQIETQSSNVLSTTQGAATSSASSIVQNTTEGFQLAGNDVTSRAAGIVDQAVAGYQEPVNKTLAEFQSSYSKGEQEVINGVTGSLASNDRVLDEMGTHCKLTEAADRAREEYDRPWWQKALLALGKAVLYLALGILAIFVLAALIFVGAWVLAAVGLITMITFKVAIVIAIVVIAVVVVGRELYLRVEAYRAEHGPITSFWEALGVAVALVVISIGSLTGIPQIIEGLRGKRFFSDIPLSSQERYDLVIGGIVQLALIFVARIFRGRFFGRRSGPVEERPPGAIEEKPPVPSVLTLSQRLAIFYQRLRAAPRARSASEALQQIRRILNEVEDEFSGVPRRDPPPPPGEFDGRMYPPQEDFVTRNSDGSINARTKGHNIEIGADGRIKITSRKSGQVEFETSGD